MAQGAASTANAAGASETVVYNGLIDGFRRTIAKEGPFAVYKVRTHTTNEHTHTQTSCPITMPPLNVWMFKLSTGGVFAAANPSPNPTISRAWEWSSLERPQRRLCFLAVWVRVRVSVRVM